MYFNFLVLRLMPCTSHSLTTVYVEGVNPQGKTAVCNRFLLNTLTQHIAIELSHSFEFGVVV